ncbi:MAG: 4Fe-4S dicluster domain-containing protein, partial [Candidatus Dadabacteria bacterium]
MGVVSLYAVPAAVIWGLYVGLRVRAARRDEAVRREFEEAGLSEPPTLHPKIDHAKCLGCGSCVAACPEHPGHRVLGIIGGKSHLVGPADCIGHGACARACPVGAITLVFGTERRGVDLPVVGPDFQTNVPGLFVAGELGGMGLIRNAVEQGKRAVENIAALPGMRAGEGLDLVIVGAGPAGLAASLAARAKGLRFVTVEQESLGGTIAHYPRGKLVMTSPFSLPGAGRFTRREVSKEELLEFWEQVVRRSGLSIRFGETVTDVRRVAEGLEVVTSEGTYPSRAVLLAIGRRGTPRKLGVPGEDLPKVVYRLVDPEQYRGQRVLVVGGGDSALEAAAGLAGVDGTEV